MSGFVVDFSFAHKAVSDALAAARLDGCLGGIAYAGCADVRKNITKAELHALLDAGYQMGLVIENFADDAIGGRPVGTRQGGAVVLAAKQLGYDWENCVLFGGYDTDAHAGDYRDLLDYMESFAAVVPVPGYYGDSDSIDYLHQRHPDWIFWQSSSASFSPRNPTPNAHLWQQVGDHRAHGLDVDVNNVLRTPLRLMGEDMATADEIAQAVAGYKLDADGKLPNTIGQYLHRTQSDVEAIKAQLEQISATVAKLAAGSVGGTLHVEGDLTVSK